MKKILLGLILVIIYTSVFSQEVQTTKKRVSARKKRSFVASQQINQLHEGVLLVRLMTKVNSIAALRKIGDSLKADKLEKQQAAYNLSIIKAFRTNFNFCPSRFFFSGESKYIIEGQFDKIGFLNDSLCLDTTIKFDGRNYFTAEFGNIEQDTAQYFSHYTYDKKEDKSFEHKSNTYGGTNMGIAALVIKSDKLVQLKRPFPYYVRTSVSHPADDGLNQTVKKMNKKLHKFYKKKSKLRS
jgi:hypothetical protein